MNPPWTPYWLPGSPCTDGVVSAASGGEKSAALSESLGRSPDHAHPAHQMPCPETKPTQCAAISTLHRRLCNEKLRTQDHMAQSEAANGQDDKGQFAAETNGEQNGL